jgi:hypothetical protein
MDPAPRPLTEADLDREIQTALAVDPSPQFVARVRTEVGNQSIASSVPWGWAIAAACAVVVAIAVTTGVKPEVARLQPSPTQIVSPTEIAAGLKPSTTNEQAAAAEQATAERATVERASNEATADHHAAGVPALRPASTYTATLKEPARLEVVVDPENAQAFQQLIGSARERRFEASFDDNPPSTPWEIAELTGPPPIIIEPLEPPAANN